MRSRMVPRKCAAFADNRSQLSHPRKPMSLRGQLGLLSLIVALLAGLAFTPGLPGEFVFDDIPNIVDNTAIKLHRLDAEGLAQLMDRGQVSGVTRTLPTLTFALDFWRAGGMDPATFKATNIVIQMLTAFALAGFFHRLFLVSGIPAIRARWLAPALALAWAAHPLQVTSVLYVVQRLQTLGTLFVLLALWAYLDARKKQIEGRSGRRGMLLAMLLWLAALGCKEDSTLLPAYTLALELTVLRFDAANPRLTGTLRRGYWIVALVGIAIFAFVVIPHYWQWDAYDGRDFSTPERLLTQARMLCMYLWQIVVPLPSHMPFFYDWVQPSRSVLHPWTTLASIVGIAGLLALAWYVRRKLPLFAFGIFLFFSAHVITSNVIGLELAFEHRNHFALIGAVLAIGSLIASVSGRLPLPASARFAASVSVLAMLVATTAIRAKSWEDKVSLARTSAKYAPQSARAWVELCAAHFEIGGGPVPGNTHLDEAITACHSGTALAPHSLNNAALLIVLKTLRGDIAPEDWNRFQHRLETVDMSWDNRRATMILTYHLRHGVKLDKARLLKALATLDRRVSLDPFNQAAIGYIILNDLGEPETALPYFMRAIEGAPPHDPFPAQLALELRQKGRPNLARQIEQLAASRRSAPEASKAPGR